MRRLIAVFSLVLALFSGGVWAVLVNPGFETGDFTGWSATGTVSVVGPGGGGPTEGAFQALLTSNANQDVAAFLGVVLPPNTGGSAITQTFSVSSATTLEFDWNFLTDESTPTAFNDFAFYVLDGVVTVLADTFSTFIPGDLGFNEQTGYASISVPIGPGSHVLAFGVVDVGDKIVDSALLVDRISIPEPATLALFGLGLAGLRLGRSRVSV